jgi:8-oxo-dGTP pyrophosphatase MutT (NUDIX family)
MMSEVPKVHVPAADAVPQWLAERLRKPPPQHLPTEGHRASAVLLPVVATPRGPHLLMVKKSSQLRKHAGQVAFPGGAIDAGETAAQAALREAWEEIGLPPQSVELLGQLDDQLTYVTGFHMTALVGWVAHPPPQWTLDRGEIDGILEIGLQELIDTEPCSWLEYAAMGQVYAMPRWEWPDGRVVWGASARVLADLQRRMRQQR